MTEQQVEVWLAVKEIFDLTYEKSQLINESKSKDEVILIYRKLFDEINERRWIILGSELF